MDVCPTGALRFDNEDKLGDLLEGAEILLPESKTKPRVYYKGIPKKFIAGALYDSEREECLEGAKITLTGKTTGEKRSTVSDDFGDFWVEGLGVGIFSLIIEKEGYQTKEIPAISTEMDVNLGDIELRRR